MRPGGGAFGTERGEIAEEACDVHAAETGFLWARKVA
jgi:hypothetical protein